MSELAVNPESDPLSSSLEYANRFDSELMSRIADGDSLAMQSLLRKHGAMLATLIGRLTAWHTDAEDIFQDVLVQVWKKAASFRNDGSLEGWLRRIAVNRCRNHFRMVNSLQRKLENFALFGIHQPHISPVYPQEPDTELQLALQQLSHMDRSAIVMFYLEQLSSDQVAKTLNITNKTLHVRLHRARKKLKKYLQAEFSDER